MTPVSASGSGSTTPRSAVRAALPQTTSHCQLTEQGRRLGTAKITNSPAELRKEIARAGKHPKVVLEATYGWYWAAGTLAAAGAEVHLAHPLGVKAFSYRRVKNDERDSADLADLLRMGRLPEAWIAPHEVRELRELTRYRIMLVRLRTSCKDQVHGVLAKLGVPVLLGHLRKGRVGVAGRPAAPAAVFGEGDLAAAPGRRADCRDHHARAGDRGPAGR
jgi:transposase